jgi:hypothetical protein
MSCSDESSSLLTSNGDVYVWGRNTEMMFPNQLSSLPIPTLLSASHLTPLKAKDISLGPKTLLVQSQTTGLIQIFGISPALQLTKEINIEENLSDRFYGRPSTGQS